MLPHSVLGFKCAWGDGNLLWKGERWARGCGRRPMRSSARQPGLWCSHPGSHSHLGEESLTHSSLLVRGFSSFVHLLIVCLSDPGCHCSHPGEIFPPSLLSAPCLSPGTSEELPGSLYQSWHSWHRASPLWWKAAEPMLLLVQTWKELPRQRKQAKKTVGDRCHHPSLAEQAKGLLVAKQG